MSKDPDQNMDPASTVPMPNEKLDMVSPPLSGESAYFEYPSSPNKGQTYPAYNYPPPAYLQHYSYPPPAYLQSGHTLPPGGQTYPVYGYSLPLGAAIKQLPKQYLRVMIRPGVAFFAQEKQKAAWNIIWVQLVFIGIIGALFSFANDTFVIPTFLSIFHISKIGAVEVSASLYRDRALQDSLSALISTPLGVFISWTIFYFIARAFKGSGAFIEYIYCCALIYVPFLVIAYSLILIPLVGLLLNLAVSVDLFILLIFMTRAVHRLNTVKASLAVLILPVSGLVLLILFFLLVFLVLIPLITNNL